MNWPSKSKVFFLVELLLSELEGRKLEWRWVFLLSSLRRGGQNRDGDRGQATNTTQKTVVGWKNLRRPDEDDGDWAPDGRRQERDGADEYQELTRRGRGRRSCDSWRRKKHGRPDDDGSAWARRTAAVLAAVVEKLGFRGEAVKIEVFKGYFCLIK